MRTGLTAMRFTRISFVIDTLPLPLPNINNDILPRSATARLILNYNRFDSQSI